MGFEENKKQYYSRCGQTIISGVIEFGVARFNTDGSLDVTFNPEGTKPGTVATQIDATGTVNEARAVAIQSDGKIVAAGQATISGVIRFAVARFLSGITDSCFVNKLIEKYGPRV